MSLRLLSDICGVLVMSRALRAVADLNDPSARAAAYIAASIEPADMRRLDKHAHIAEAHRRRLFPQPEPEHASQPLTARPHDVAPVPRRVAEPDAA